MFGGTRLVIGGVRLARGSHYVCRFSEGGTDVAETAAHNDGVVGCDTPAGVEGSLTISVSLNAQQYTNTSLSFYRYAPPSLYALSPASGPTGGATVVTVSGNASLRAVNYSEPRCRFGVGGQLNGTFTSWWGMRCIAPANVQTGVLEVSLNAQQFTRSELQYEAYEPPTLVGVHPSLGPSGGATNLTLRTTTFTGTGTDVRCRFENVNVSTTEVAARIEPARTFACTTPSLNSAAYSLRVSLNGQQFSNDLRFSSLTPPHASSVYPLSG